MSERYISSPHNPLVKLIAQLEKPAARKEYGLFVVEGQREIALAQAAGYTIETVLSSDELLLAQISAAQKILVSSEIMSKIAVRGENAGAVALCRPLVYTPDSVRWSDRPLVLVVESVEKPGNLGAILRTADAAGVDAVWVCDPQTDLFNPNVVRSSLGCLFTVPVLISSAQHCLDFLSAKGFRIYAAIVNAPLDYTEADFGESSAIVLGSEAFGLSHLWHLPPVIPISIAMHGKVDSMNVSVCAGIVAYEALRQRKQKTANLA